MLTHTGRTNLCASAGTVTVGRYIHTCTMIPLAGSIAVLLSLVNVRALSRSSLRHQPSMLATPRKNPTAGLVQLCAFEEDTVDAESPKKPTLEEKMKSWESTEEEIKAASLGGLVPSGNRGGRTDAFDIGLYIAFPLMVLSGLAFALFPLIMGNIDVDSVGPPPAF